MKDGLLVILCIGSDKIAGDSIGPLVGAMLRSLDVRCFVYGVTGDSINGKNLEDFKNLIGYAHPNSKIISVDACLKTSDFSNDVIIKSGGVCPKCALDKKKNSLGDIGILGLIKKEEDGVLYSLMTTSIDNVHKIAVKISIALYKTLKCA